MAEVDFIVIDLSLNYSGILDIKELYEIIKKNLQKRKYSVVEKKYDAKSDGVKISLANSKAFDDYYKASMGLEISANNIKDVKVKNKKLNEADLSIKFTASLEHDYEGNYESRPPLKFFRAIYDKFVNPRTSKYENTLKEETYDIYNEIKSYLNVTKFQ